MPPSWNLPWSLNLKVISSFFESLWQSLYTPLKLLNTSYNFISRPCLIHHFPSPGSQGFPRGSAGKESTCNKGDLGSIPGLGRSPGEGKGLPTPVFWPGEFHGLYSPWIRKESDTIEQLSQAHVMPGIFDSVQAWRHSEHLAAPHVLIFLYLSNKESNSITPVVLSRINLKKRCFT